jgi:hypothetical protein
MTAMPSATRATAHTQCAFCLFCAVLYRFVRAYGFALERQRICVVAARFSGHVAAIAIQREHFHADRDFQCADLALRFFWRNAAFQHGVPGSHETLLQYALGHLRPVRHQHMRLARDEGHASSRRKW